MKQLPPKRFQDYYDSKFDECRWLPWFRLLEHRRGKIPALSEAYKLVNAGMEIGKAADEFTVDVRELRDYRDFLDGRSKLSEIEPIGTRRAYQGILDQSYDVYVDTHGSHPWHKILQSQSQLFGVNARPVIEIWEVDPVAYPTHYRGVK